MIFQLLMVEFDSTQLICTPDYRGNGTHLKSHLLNSCRASIHAALGYFYVTFFDAKQGLAVRFFSVYFGHDLIGIHGDGFQLVAEQDDLAIDAGVAGFAEFKVIGALQYAPAAFVAYQL